MTNRHSHEAWKRLGSAVQAARMRRDDWADTAEWASVVGRSTRVMLGLERGEPTGAKTLRRIEDLLGWPVNYCDKILSDPHANLAPGVPRVLAEQYGYDPPPRALDSYTTAELLHEVEQRFAETALELHAFGRPAMSAHQEGPDEVLEPMSPQQRRDELRRRRDDEPTNFASRRAQNGDTGASDQE